jgi:hypothetical protein
MTDAIDVTFTYRLQEDHQRCANELLWCEAKDRPFWRRTAYRTQFEFLEAWMSVNRRHLIPGMARERMERLAADERKCVERLLAVTDPDVHRKTAFLDNLKAIVRLCLLLSDAPTARVDGFIGRPEWDALRQASQVRDRIAHPRTGADYEITDEETLYLVAMSRWFVEFFDLVKYADLPAIQVADGYAD